jgi:hypothetical protein
MGLRAKRRRRKCLKPSGTFWRVLKPDFNDLFPLPTYEIAGGTVTLNIDHTLKASEDLLITSTGTFRLAGSNVTLTNESRITVNGTASKNDGTYTSSVGTVDGTNAGQLTGG